MKNQPNLQEKEPQKKIDYSGLLLFLCPFFLIYQTKWMKEVVKSRSWTKLRTKKERRFVVSIFSIPIIAFALYFSIRSLLQGKFEVAAILYFTYILSQYPISRMYLLYKLNQQLKHLDNGKIDPDSRRKLKRAKLEHEWIWAPRQYQKVFQSMDTRPEAIGVRVNPVEAPVPFRKKPADLTQDEFGPVINGELAIFPLNENSPDHHIVIGQTGSGKTVLLRRMIASALDRGWQVALIDLKGDLADVEKFARLAKSKNRVRHFPTHNFDFWTGSKENIAERIISIIPPNGNPFYTSRNITGINAVITRCGANPPQSVDELIHRFRNPKAFIQDPTDFKFLTTKEHGMAVGELIANDLMSYLDPIRTREKESPAKFSWGNDWDLAIFSLNGFETTSLTFANVVLNDFANWMSNTSYTRRNKPLLLVIDEASALQRLPQVPVLTALMERARSAKVSIVLTAQTYTSFGEHMDQIIHSGSIRWLGLSSLVDVMIEATGTKAVVESGHQFSDGEFTGVVSHREQKEFKIDPEAVRSLPTFFWYVGKSAKASSVYVPPKE
jgi:hypothetical protein